MMKLFLIRHGETDWMSEGKLQGRSQVSLNERGKKQAQAGARFIKNVRPTRLISSSLLRAQETAYWIHRECGLSVRKDPRLNEIFFGEWEGKSHEEIQENFPGFYQDWLELSENFKAPGGESIQTVRHRILSFFAEIRSYQGTVAAVSHGGPIRLLILDLLKEPLRFFRFLKINPGSVTSIEDNCGDLKITGIHPETGKENSLIFGVTQKIRGLSAGQVA